MPNKTRGSSSSRDDAFLSDEEDPPNNNNNNTPPLRKNVDKGAEPRVRFVNQAKTPWDVRLVTRHEKKKDSLQEAPDEQGEKGVIEMVGMTGKTPWDVKFTKPARNKNSKKKKDDGDEESEEGGDDASDDDGSESDDDNPSRRRRRRTKHQQNKNEDADAIKLVAAVQRARRIEMERRRTSKTDEEERLSQLLLPHKRGFRHSMSMDSGPHSPHVNTHMDARIPARIAWEIAEDGGGGKTIAVNASHISRKWGGATTDTDRLVCLRNYAAVGVDIDIDEKKQDGMEYGGGTAHEFRRNQNRKNNKNRKCYGLIDRGEAAESGIRALLLHVRGGESMHGRHNSIMGAVRAGSILQVYSTSPSSVTGTGSKSQVKVRYTTPARYYSPGEKITTLRLGVDAADWQRVMPKYRRI